jgi:hypothetical protein
LFYLFIFISDFNLELRPSSTAHLFKNVTIEISTANSTNHLNIFDLLVLYEGVLTDEANESHVSGSLLGGHFHGTIHSNKRGTFFVESAKKFNKSIDTATIIYNENEVNLSGRRRARRETTTTTTTPVSLGCGFANRNIREWMRNEQRKLYDERIKEVKESLLIFYSSFSTNYLITQINFLFKEIRPVQLHRRNRIRRAADRLEKQLF